MPVEQEIDYDNMPIDELNKLGKEIVDGDLNAVEDDEPDELEETEVAVEPDDDNGEPEGGIELESEPEQKLDKNGNPVTGDPLKDTKAALTRTQQENAELKRRIERAEREAKLAGYSGLDYDEDELALIRESDPDQYLEIKQRMADKKTAENDLHAYQSETRLHAQIDQMKEFVNAHGITEDKVADFFSSPEFLEVDKYLTDNVKPEGPSGEYTTRQINMVFQGLHGTKILDSQKVSRERKQRMKEKAEQSSIMSNGRGTPGPKGNIDVSKLTIDDIDKMTPEELAALEKKFK